MLPSILAKQLQQGLSDYIGTTFPMTNEAVICGLTPEKARNIKEFAA